MGAVDGATHRVESFVIGNPGRAVLELADGPPAVPIGRADVELSAVSLEGLILRAATVRGVSHREDLEPRQDAFALAYGEVTQGGLVAVVCDGVGQYAASFRAADLAAQQIAELGSSGLDWATVFRSVNQSLLDELKAVRAAADDESAGLATTAVAVRITPADQGWNVSMAWAGDSTGWLLDSLGQWSCLTRVVDGRDDDLYSSSAVRALPSGHGAVQTDEFSITTGAVFLVSDGVGNPLAGSGEVREQLGTWWAAAPDPYTFAAQVDFARRGHTDDRTAVGIWLSEIGGAE
ncbi:hypothetical protein F1D05_26175 [Kribbella qitaiheensis]|uniref:PPM-type phosphatase domain-containing protein n=1 Tax=Kribbella qitaiheensis TaxID=1544730 RepID=A0A7G6X3E6_9ACTN|nr:protein phosphatase 2C domain-containing protein [Kribbella qitaiheensis]QNE20761.1 hypothetical protein F1D05_26175 [Kribbella qitaiheensis]